VLNPGIQSVDRRARIIAIILSAGVIAVMLIALSYKAFELDRYFVPKELVLNSAALLIAVIMLTRSASHRLDTVDALIVFFLVWSGTSTLFADNLWAAQRALGLSVSSAVIFWGARRASEGGMHRVLLGAAGAASVVAAVTSLAQAYGFESDWFTLARAPGGTLGNRNFIAHVAAIGLPSILWSVVAGKHSAARVAATLGAAILAGTLVLSRSRAAWLAVIAFMIIGTILIFVSRRYWRDIPIGARLARGLAAIAIGGTLAIILPNTLEWKSDSPYLESARKVVDYSSGSGKGRVAQYRNSLRMSEHNPIFGVGPGNWPVQYPRFAPGGDKSLAESGMTANPWPSSDWVAFVSERGFAAAVALLGAFAALFLGSLRRWSEASDADLVMMKVALAGTVVSVMIVSAFDAVLLLPAPAFLAWMIIGASVGPRHGGRDVDVSTRPLGFAVPLILLVVAIAVLRTSTQIVAMTSVGTGGRTAGWVNAALWDPGSYRINQKVAELYARRGQCSRARGYSRQAISLFPRSPQARSTARRCGLKLNPLPH
jgi:O-antigen ligase